MELALIPPLNWPGPWETSKFHLVTPAQARDSLFVRPQGYVILDNGAPEGEDIHIWEFKNLIEKVQPDEIVLPDVMRNFRATRRKTEWALDQLQVFVENRVHHRCLFHAVAQGTNLSELMACLSCFFHNEMISVIGVPRHMNDWYIDNEVTVSPRAALLRALAHDPQYSGGTYHALGAHHKWPAEIVDLARIENVRSQDTSLPIVYGLRGINVANNTRGERENATRQEGYFTTPYEHVGEETRDLIRTNCNAYLYWATAPGSNL